MSAIAADKPLDIQNYQQVKDAFTLMSSGFERIRALAQVNRRLRKLSVDVESLRSMGKLRPDQTFIARRVIDSNIKNEQPPFIAYLKQSRRLAVFKCLSEPNLNVDELEAEFTEGMQYNGWEIDYFKCLDGAQLHGWDSIEIEYDDSKPLKVGISHIGFENLLMPVDCKQLGANDMLARRFEVTPSQLRTFARYNFAPEMVTRLCATQGAERTRLIDIYKVFLKDENGIIWVGWVSSVLDGWLSVPVKLDLGRRQKVTITEMVPTQLASGTVVMIPTPREDWQPIDETEFPIKLLSYSLTEQQQITEQIGRAQLDDADQEAQTNLWTSAVNGALRASNVYGSPEQDESNGGKLSVVDVDLVPDRIYNKKINWWSPPWPEGFVVQLSQAMGVAKQAETGSVDFAVNNRQDSRKTATEIDAAKQQAGLLQGVQVMLWAAWLRNIFTYVWPVVQNLALRDEIKLLSVTEQVPVDPNMPEMTKPQTHNDTQVLSQTFDIKPAGDIDVVQRAEKLQRMQTIWPIVAQTPLAMPFLMDIIKEMFPQDAARYGMLLQQGDQKNQLLQGTLGIMKELMNTPTSEIGANLEHHKDELMKMGQQIQQVLQQP